MRKIIIVSILLVILAIFTLFAYLSYQAMVPYPLGPAINIPSDTVLENFFSLASGGEN